jgi:hypothetical protein
MSVKRYCYLVISNGSKCDGRASLMPRWVAGRKGRQIRMTWSFLERDHLSGYCYWYCYHFEATSTAVEH